MTKPVILVCLLICLMAMVLLRESFGQDKLRCGSAYYRRKFGVCGKRGMKRAPAAEFIDELKTRNQGYEKREPQDSMGFVQSKA